MTDKPREPPLTLVKPATMPAPPPLPPMAVTLDRLAKNLELIRTLSPTDVRTFAILASAVMAGLNQALLAEPEADKLVDIKEASIKLGMSRDYLYRNFRSLPFAVAVGRAKRFSSRGIEQYLERRPS